MLFGCDSINSKIITSSLIEGLALKKFFDLFSMNGEALYLNFSVKLNQEQREFIINFLLTGLGITRVCPSSVFLVGVGERGSRGVGRDVEWNVRTGVIFLLYYAPEMLTF